MAANLDTFLSNLEGVDPGALSIHWYPLGEWPGEDASNPAFPSLPHLVINNNQNHEISYLETGELELHHDRRLLDQGLRPAA